MDEARAPETTKLGVSALVSQSAEEQEEGETLTTAVESTAKRRRTWKRKLAIAGIVALALVVIGAGALWILKPWVPEIELTGPGPTGRRVIGPGLYANYFAAEGVVRGPAVVVLGGSEGGIGPNTTRTAVKLQELGFSVLTPAYFGAPGQPKTLEHVPLETFDRALAWLRARKEVDAGRIAVAGQSKGAEAALLVATRHPGLAAVVASAPTSAVWPGINWTTFPSRAKASWTSSGRPLAVLPYGARRSFSLFGPGSLYTGGLKRLSRHPKAVIAVERIKAPVLLMCGERDTLWPSCAMARQVKRRATQMDGPPVQILAYKQAGHRVFGPAVPPGTANFKALGRWGGTPAANNAARADAWPKFVDFLRTHLGRAT